MIPKEEDLRGVTTNQLWKINFILKKLWLMANLFVFMNAIEYKQRFPTCLSQLYLCKRFTARSTDEFDKFTS